MRGRKSRVRLPRLRASTFLPAVGSSRRYSRACNELHYGVFVFDGVGKFAGKQSSSRDGKIGREKLEGTYTLDSDCTGTMTFGGIMDPSRNVHWDFFLTEDHKRGHMIRMDEGNMAVRSFEK